MNTLSDMASRRRGRTVAVLALLLASGCVTTIGRLNPRPNIAMVPQNKSMRLALGQNIADHLDIEVGNNTLKVEAWRQTLADAFNNGFTSAYQLTNNGNADLVLTLDEVRLEIGEFEHARSRVQYKASVYRGGVVIWRSAGLAKKTQPAFSGPVAMDDDLLAADISGAVEAMYEQIAKELTTLPPS